MAAATVRLFTRRGYDWTDRHPAIAGAAAKLRAWTARRWCAGPLLDKADRG
jgi:ATP-dependent DNA ligase